MSGGRGVVLGNAGVSPAGRGAVSALEIWRNWRRGRRQASRRGRQRFIARTYVIIRAFLVNFSDGR
jgi:hypothetical protein